MCGVSSVSEIKEVRNWINRMHEKAPVVDEVEKRFLWRRRQKV